MIDHQKSPRDQRDDKNTASEQRYTRKFSTLCCFAKTIPFFIFFVQLRNFAAAPAASAAVAEQH
jgi:hypothetical protein